MNRAKRRALAREAVNKTSKGTASSHEPDQKNNPISEAQLNANRANAQHSTGPKTSAGRATSSQNRLTHGLARHNGVFTLLATEEPSAFEAFKTGLLNAHEPADEFELNLVNAMAESRWLADRAQNLSNDCLDLNTGQITDLPMYDRYLRYHTKHTRDFQKAFNDLLKHRAAKQKVANGFEAHRRHNEELRLKTERQAMKKQSENWINLRKKVDTELQIAQNVLFKLQAVAQHPGFEAQYEAELAQHVTAQAA